MSRTEAPCEIHAVPDSTGHMGFPGYTEPCPHRLISQTAAG